MRRHELRRALGRLCAAALLLLAAQGALAASEPEAMALHAATVTTRVDGVTRGASLQLPYHWDRQHAGRPGTAHFELPFVLSQPPSAPWGLFIPRAGSAFEVSLNGSLLQVFGDLSTEGGADYGKAPIYVPLPKDLLKPGLNTLQIDLRADSGRRAGLSTVTVGPATLVRHRLYESAYAWRFTGSVLLTAFSLFVGVTAFALWLTQVDASVPARPRREHLYLWAAIAEFCWAMRVADGAIRNPPLPWVEWGTLMTACYSGWAGAVVMFCQHLAGWHGRPGMRWLERAALGVFTIPVVVCYFALSRARPDWLTIWLAIEVVAVVAYVSFFVAATVRRPSLPRVLVALVAVLTVAAAGRDWAVIRLSDAYGSTTWVRYTSTLFGLALLGLVISRFREASAKARDLLQTLASRVADREHELALVYERLEQGAREQARTQERERILRDMHDGVGSHISAAIRQLQSGQGSDAEVLRTLRDSLDQLKLSIDSIHLPPGDVGALLAGLRYRMTPRFAAAGLSLEWAVDELAPVANLDGAAMRQLQFLLFEAISNVLQHAQASVLRIEAAKHGLVLRLCVIDNGRGFDAERLAPRALSERARAIGARLRMQSRPGRTVAMVEFGL
ncbi:sensor histidine kinase [Variovorax sp. PAMC 28711]|uniref:sensor histidine kinase n=1 Tax=Variovorax sp. PAMC 28711 TaxID=1795631 RepID=UPI00078D706F|nr:histidine kinase [Variovorax sp. PAMC 28711]AMM24090.1 histidine kinase [Variovorax sp. PAMC 28711]